MKSKTPASIQLPPTPEYVTETYERKGKTLKKRVYNTNSPVGKKIREVLYRERLLEAQQQEINRLKAELLPIVQSNNLSRIELTTGEGLNRKRDTKWQYDKATQAEITGMHLKLNALQISGRAKGRTRFYLAR